MQSPGLLSKCNERDLEYVVRRLSTKHDRDPAAPAAMVYAPAGEIPVERHGRAHFCCDRCNRVAYFGDAPKRGSGVAAVGIDMLGLPTMSRSRSG